MPKVVLGVAAAVVLLVAGAYTAAQALQGASFGYAPQVTPWQSRIARSRLAVIAGGGFHPAAVAPDLCAETARAFLREVFFAALVAEHRQRGGPVAAGE